MAGTIVADTIQDGAGNSTAMDNAIYGSAKAWVNFNGSTAVIRASYNVSSITRTAAGTYYLNFTNALVDANYIGIAQVANPASTGNLQPIAMGNGGGGQSTTQYNVITTQASGYSYADQTYVWVVIFR